MPLRKRYWARIYFLLFVSAALLTTCVSRKEVASEYYRIGQDMFRIGQYSHALDYFQRADEFYPTSSKGDFNVAMIHLLNQNYEDAQELITGLLALDPENTEVWELQAYLYYHDQEQVIKSLAVYEWLLSEDVIKDRIVHNAIRLHWTLYNAEAVIELYPMLTQTSLELQWTYIQALAMEQRTEEALSEASDYQGNLDGEGLRELGDWYEETGDFERALAIWNKLLEQQTDDPELLFRKAHVLLVQRIDFVQGVQVLEEAVNNGFSDTDRLDALLEEDLFDKESVQRVIE